ASISAPIGICTIGIGLLSNRLVLAKPNSINLINGGGAAGPDGSLASSDLSSLSGDEDEDDSDSPVASQTAALRRSPRHQLLSQSGRLFFLNKDREYVSIARCLFDLPAPSEESLLSRAAALPRMLRWAILMLAGGHFAGAIFDESGRAVAHKTFHQYAVRKRQGGLQSARAILNLAALADRNLPGANLRRRCEAHLREKIQNLLASWTDELNACHFVLIRISKQQQAIFLGPPSPIAKSDPRVSPHPNQPPGGQLTASWSGCTVSSPACTSTTRDADAASIWPGGIPTAGQSNRERPSYCQPIPRRIDRRRQDAGSSFQCLRGIPAGAPVPSGVARRKKKSSSSSTSAAAVAEQSVKTDDNGDGNLQVQLCDEEPLEAGDDDQPAGAEASQPADWALQNQLFTAVACADPETLDQLLSELASSEPDSVASVSASRWVRNAPHCCTCRRQTAAAGQCSACWSQGLTPASATLAGRTPYQLAGNKSVREAFRKFCGQTAGLARLRRRIKKRGAAKAAKRGQGIGRNGRPEAAAQAEADERERFQRHPEDGSGRRTASSSGSGGVSTVCGGPNQKPLILSRCFQCAADITGKVPFHYRFDTNSVLLIACADIGDKTAAETTASRVMKK
uniref:BVLRF1 domain-containing protein n=1 Tax=Macrostomum lignano TaxID=282301 RepID=A0A1I8FAV2_9PLAT